MENDGLIKKNIKEKIKKYNYGLAFLKSILAFTVLISHNFNNNSTKNKIILFITKNRKTHVPSFFILSFYFSCNNLLSLNIKNFLKRIIRLLLPYIIWPVIVLKINYLFNLIHKKKLLSDDYQSLKIQLLWGRRYMNQFWFQWNLIATTILFYSIILIIRKHCLFIFLLLLIFSYISQYSGYYYNNCYMKYAPHKRYTIARMYEVIPFAVTGFIIGFYKVMKIIQNIQIKTFIISIIVYNAVKDYKIFSDIRGVSFYGIHLNIQSICLIFIFSLFPLNNIKNNYLKRFINIILNYSAGIYYLHVSIHNYLKFDFNVFKDGTFLCIIINYIICCCICHIGMLFFSQSPLKYLFC